MRKKIVFIAWVLIFRLLLDWIYKNEIAPFFGYANYVDNSSEISNMTSWCYLLIFAPFVVWIVDTRYNTFSQIIALFLMFFRIIPFTSLMKYMPQSTEYVVANFVYWNLIFLLLKYLKPQNPFGILKKSGGSENAINLITIIATLTVIYVSGVYCGFRIHLSLDDVYELRFEAREFNMPVLLKYLHAATSNIIPILMVYYILNKKKIFVYFLAFVGLLNFSVAGHKSTLFKILLCLGLFFFPKMDLKKYMPVLFIMLCIFTIAEFLWINTIELSTIFIRRGFFVPTSLDVSYFNYITQHGPTYFTEGIAFKLGSLSGDDAKRCNNGMFSDAFMNLGYIGCVVFPLLFSYFVKTVEYVITTKVDSLKVFSAFIIVSTLASSYFTTSMLTHGMLMLGLTLYCFPTHSCNLQMEKSPLQHTDSKRKKH